MKTNTNLKKINAFFTVYSSKLIHLISEVFSVKLTTAFGKVSLLLFFVFSTSSALGQFGSCAIDLKVAKDRNTRSTPIDGTYYTMQITNKGRTADTFYLSSSNINTTCTNNDGSSSRNNVILDALFLDKQLKSINEIKANPGETISFLVRIVVPKNTPFNKWSCTQITAKSKLCSNYKVDTVLHTLVVNSNEE